MMYSVLRSICSRSKAVLLTGFIVVVAGLSIVLGACGLSAAQVRTAKGSGYRADFATVYGLAMAAVTARYPYLTENAASGVIQTAWHPVAGQGTGQRGGANGGTEEGTRSATTTVSGEFTRFFIRFRVRVVGGSPWRVEVFGEASEIRSGEVPSKLLPGEIPSWVEGRTDELRVAIHKRLETYAVQVVVRDGDSTSETHKESELRSFGTLPNDANQAIGKVYKALLTRNVDALRPYVASDVQWSVSASGNADVAMAMWRADARILDGLLKALEDGCAVAADNSKLVECKGSRSQYRAAFSKRSGGWLLSTLVAVE